MAILHVMLGLEETLLNVSEKDILLLHLPVQGHHTCHAWQVNTNVGGERP
jgi:hypothetical protein